MEHAPTTGVVITGGASGIGLATAVALAEVARPVAIWDLDAGRVGAALEQLGGADSVIGCVVDVRDESAIASAVEETRGALGSIGGFVHAAGNVIPEPIGEIDWDHWSAQIDVHLNAFARIVQTTLPDLRRHGGSSIVGISSINGLIGGPTNPAYCAAKAGMLGLTRSLTASLGPFGIRVNAICPGYVETEMTRAALQSAAVRERFVDASALKRIGNSEEIGRAVRFLLSDDASFVTGQALAVDGGVTTTA